MQRNNNKFADLKKEGGKLSREDKVAICLEVPLLQFFLDSLQYLLFFTSVLSLA